MTPLFRWFRNAYEKLFGKFFEGPQPPARLGEIVIVFANKYPAATRDDWVRFATEHANECYRSGWVRGYERGERDPDERDIIAQARPEVLADALEHDWRWSPEVVLNEPERVPKESAQTEAEEVEELMRELRDEQRKRQGRID
jgi:hypothetical protein